MVVKDKKTDNIGKNNQNKKRKKRRKYLLIMLLVVVGLLLPWPADNSDYHEKAYYTNTLATLQNKEFRPIIAETIQIGTSEVDITPTTGHPLAGFAARRPMEFTEIHKHCYARALTIKYDSQQFTILTADLLTIHPNVSEEVLLKAGLEAQDVYFTASHTHSGPGGYVNRWAEETTLGKYNQQYFDELSTKLSSVIKESRQELKPAEIGLITVDANDMLKNQLDENLPTYGKLSALVFRESSAQNQAGEILAVLISFSAHPILLTQHQHLLSSSYPGVLVGELKKTTGAKTVSFAAGAVGSSRPTFPAARPEDRYERSEAYGKILAEKLSQQFQQIEFKQQVIIANLLLDVELPKFRIGLGKSLQTNPILTPRLLDRQTQLHVVRIGNTVLAGFPADYGCDLAIELEKWCNERQINLIPTSFNGDWKGYIVSGDTFSKYTGYETRLMSFFGASAGDYLNDIAKQMIIKTEL